MAIQKWKGEDGTIVTPLKAMPMTTREPNTQMHAPCIDTQLGNHTCNLLPTSLPIDFA